MRISDWSSDVCSSDLRIARLLKGQSRFGAELDSLSDVIAFGVSPAIIIYLWSLQHFERLGWIFALAHAVCCALRLARFNANLDVDDQPHKSAGFFTGIPSPAGAGVALAPVYLWLRSEEHTSEIQSLMRISYDVFCLEKQT